MPALPLLLAQEVVQDSSGDNGFNWLYLFNPAVVWVLIPIIAILGGTVAKIIQRTQEHRERMAMIAAGMHPDHPLDEEVRDTEYEKVGDTAIYSAK